MTRLRHTAARRWPAFGLSLGLALVAFAGLCCFRYPQFLAWSSYRTPSAMGMVPAPYPSPDSSLPLLHGAYHPTVQSFRVGAVPARIEIPDLRVSARVLSENVLSSGALAIPDNSRDVGWWGEGMRPGASAGTALIAGHVDSRATGAGAFFALDRLRKGSLIRVTGTDRSTATYRVAARAVYRKSSLPPELFALGGQHRLALVTCGGQFDRATHSYEYNVVVYALPSRG